MKRKYLSKLYTPIASTLLALPLACAAVDDGESIDTVHRALEAVPDCDNSVYEAVDMFQSTGGPTEGGWNIWSDGYVSTTHNFEGGTTTLTLVVRGEVAGEAAPNMSVTVGGNEVYSTAVGSSDWSEYNFTFESAAGEQEVEIHFTNDFYQDGQDRNLHVAELIIGCGVGLCGNGSVDLGEECDNGSQTSADSCKMDCTWNSCGDGVVYTLLTDESNPNAIEDCDDGNDIEDDECTNSCTLPTCGDEVLHDGEECDDGNTEDGDGCSSECVLEGPICGDGEEDEGEECDDGNSVNDDECTNACTDPICGDAIVQADEECDDGNTEDGDGCSMECQVEPFCGDGEEDEGEECDDGNSVNDDECTNACTDPICGDAIVQADEECDDGNTEDGDGCSMECVSEASASGAINVSNEWPSGYCATLEITNDALDETSTWSAVIDLGDATTFTTWSGGFSGDTGEITLSPDTWNSVIPAGGTNATVGFCVNHAPETPTAFIVSVDASY